MTPSPLTTEQTKRKAKMVVAYLCDHRDRGDGWRIHLCPEPDSMHSENDEPHGLVKESDLD